MGQAPRLNYWLAARRQAINFKEFYHEPKREEFNHEPHEQGANLESGEIYYKYAFSRKKRIRGFCLRA